MSINTYPPPTLVTLPITEANVTGLVDDLARKGRIFFGTGGVLTYPTPAASGVTLPIAESDVTNLVADLALKCPFVLGIARGVQTFPTPAGSGVTLPIAESDVTNLPADLALRSPLIMQAAVGVVTFPPSTSSTPSGAAGGDLSGTYPNPTVANAAVTLAKIANAAANSKLLGSGSAGSGASYSELTLGSNLSMSGTTLSVTGGGGGAASWTELTPVSPSAASNVDFTGLASYNELLVVARALTATVSGVRRIQVSVDNGSTFDSTAANYQSVTTLGVEANSATPGIAYHGTNSTSARTLIAHIKNLKGAVKHAHFQGADTHIIYVGSASDIDAIRINSHNGGTISGGPIYVYAR